MHDAQNRIIYVGKASSLRQRLASYFSSGPKDNKTTALVKHIVRIDYWVLSSEFEALLLEQDLIKHHRPKYNILLKDDKTYPYLVLTSGAFPRIILARGVLKRLMHLYPEAVFLGPFPESKKARATLEWVQKSLKLRSCTDYVFAQRTRPCLQYQIEQCHAPCVGLITPEAYQEHAQMAKDLFLKNHSALRAQLEKHMLAASGALDFERAAQYRDMLQCVDTALATDPLRQHMKRIDLWASCRWQDHVLLGVLRLHDGHVEQMRLFEPFYYADLDDWDDVLIRYYDQHSDVLPEVIRVAEPIRLQYFSDWYRSVHHRSMGRVRSQHLSDWFAVLYKNLDEKIMYLDREYGILPLVDYEAFLVAMGYTDPIMLALDISHTGGTHTIGAAAAFEGNAYSKTLSRSHRLMPSPPGNDLSALSLLAKQLHARFKRWKRLPALLVVDGGVPQLQAVLQVLHASYPSCDYYAVSKGPKRVWGEESVYRFQGGHIEEQSLEAPVFRTLLRLRDAAHRQANGQHRRLRTRMQTAETDLP